MCNKVADRAQLIIHMLMNQVPDKQKQKLVSIELKWVEKGEYAGNLVLPELKLTFTDSFGD